MDNQELIDIARESLIRLRPIANHISSYGCVNSQGIISVALVDQICHASCPSFVYSQGGVILYTITTGLSKILNIPSEIKERYFTWLCSADSPWADCLNNGLNSDAKFVVEYGLLITNLGKLGKNLVMGALSASRACYEHPQHILMWDSLVTDGVDPRWAFFLAGLMTMQDGKVFYGMRSNTNHWPLWPTTASEQYIKNYLTQNVTFDNVPFSSAVRGKSVGGVWGPFNDSVNTQSLSKFWINFKRKAHASVVTIEFDTQEASEYEDVLLVAKQEWERLHAA